MIVSTITQLKAWACLRQTCSRSPVIIMCQLLVTSLVFLVAFWKWIILKSMMDQLVGWDLCVPQQDRFRVRQECKQVHFSKKTCPHIVFWTVRDGRSTQIFTIAWTLERFSYNLTETRLLNNTFDHFTMLCKNLKSSISSRCKPWL